jgi:Glycosyl transferase family 2
MGASEPVTRCVVVTPTFDSAAYLDETIASVVMQVAPAVALDYHIQDGGSRDATGTIVARWIERIERRLIPIQLHSLRLTFESMPDDGMYDAINRGFVHLGPRDRDLVTWINSDDRLAPGAVATVHRVWADNPGCDFVSGRTALINADGALVSINAPQAYPRSTLAAGLHDGRSLPFIMQEGTFFSGALWGKVGGVRSSFRLAGDWDLWRRMAREAVHFSVDTITAFHRRRPGQLSSDIALYHAEVDALEKDVADLGALDSEAHLIRYDPDTDRWVKAPFAPFAARPPIAIVDGRRRDTVAVTYGAGFGAPEGPYPEFRLPAGVRWLKEDWAEIRADVRDEGMARVRLVLRPTEADLRIRLHLNGNEVAVVRLGDPVPDTDQLVEFSAWLSMGSNMLDLELPPSDDSLRRLLIVSCTIISAPDDARLAPHLIAPDAARALGELAVVIEAGDSPTAMVDTLASLREVTETALFLRADPDTDVGAAATCFAPQAQLVGAEQPTPAHLAAGGYTLLLTVAGGDRIERAALVRALELRTLRDAEAAAGLTDLIDGGGVTHRRLLPDSDTARLSLVNDEARSAVPIVAPFAVARRVAEQVSDSEAPSVVWILDDATAPEISPLYALAGALRMLGVDARHVCASRGDIPPAYRPLRSHLTIKASSMADDGSLLVRIEGEQMVLEGGDRAARLPIPLAIDAETFRPRSRSAARARLGLGTDPVVIVDADQLPALEPALTQIGDGSIAVVVLRRPEARETRYRSLPWPNDPESLSHILCAADAVLVQGPECGALGRAACACGIAVLGPLGSIVTPERAVAPAARGLAAVVRRLAANGPYARRIGVRARDAVLRSASVEAAAVALHAKANAFPHEPLAEWMAARRWLTAGDIEVPTSAEPMLRGAELALHRNAAVRILSGAEPGSDPHWPGAIRFAAVSVVLLLRTSAKLPGATLRLHLAGTDGAAWSVQADDGPSVPFAIGSGAITTIRLPVPGSPGLHRVELSAANPVAQQSVSATHILAWEVVADRMPAEPEATATRLVPAPLTGRQVAVLSRDGDWCPLDNFLKTEGPHPLGGLFGTFRWTTGTSSSILLKVEHGGVREIDFALTGMTSGQRLRVVVDGAASAWSSPLEAYVGRVTHRSWTIDWREGDIPVTVELDVPSSTANPRSLGILILGVRLH